MPATQLARATPASLTNSSKGFQPLSKTRTADTSTGSDPNPRIT
jgi:hypothetical protein